MDTREERWRHERQFFDAEEYPSDPIPSNTIERYARCDRPFLAAERPFAIMGDVRGKRVLEIGCGGGANSVILALKGATVVGVDISPKAIQAARQLAARHGVEDRVDFQAIPLESYLALNQGQPFDVICGFAVLHHLLPVLGETLTRLATAAHPETTWVFSEPVATSQWMQNLRLRLPLKVDGTPDERPLNNADLAVIREHLPAMKMDLFCATLRFWTRAFPGRYEDYPTLVRSLYNALGRIDAALLSAPIFRPLSSIAVIHSGPLQVAQFAA